MPPIRVFHGTSEKVLEAIEKQGEMVRPCCDVTEYKFKQFMGVAGGDVLYDYPLPKLITDMLHEGCRRGEGGLNPLFFANTIETAKGYGSFIATSGAVRGEGELCNLFSNNLEHIQNNCQEAVERFEKRCKETDNCGCVSEEECNCVAFQDWAEDVKSRKKINACSVSAQKPVVLELVLDTDDKKWQQMTKQTMNHFLKHCPVKDGVYECKNELMTSGLVYEGEVPKDKIIKIHRL